MRPTVVFTGPSLAAEEVTTAWPEAEVAPPARRGDLAAACASGARTVLLIDGAFAHVHAVSPGEVVSVLRSGVRVVGAASLGALRAAECAPAGMEGVGAVHRLLCLGVLQSDDEVAVAVEPDAGHRAASDALVTVRFAVLAGLREGRLAREAAGRILAAARATHFSERRWPSLLAAAGVPPDDALLALPRRHDPKRRDAVRAVAMLAGESAPGAQTGPSRVERGPSRPPGHDPLLGMSPSVARAALHRWVCASGRYRRYWPEPPQSPEATWAALDAAAELEGELLRLHAVRTGAGLRSGADGPALAPWLDAARAEIALAYGAEGWHALEAGLKDAPGHPGATLAEVRCAATALALARRNLGAPRPTSGTA